MYQNICATLFKLLLVGTLLFAGFGCDSVLPDEFKSKDYTIAPLDSRASALLMDSTKKVIQSKSLASFADSATRATHTENQIILSKFNTMLDSLQQLVQDTLMWVKYPANQNVTYALLTISPGQSKNIYIYTSLFYYSGNINEYITVQLVKSDTTVVVPTDDMPAETITGSFGTIRGRYKVQLDQEGVYLVRFTLSSPSAISNPQKAPKIDNQFKVTILSF
jgi:hypothetical protein